jgi:hypothetical protein
MWITRRRDLRSRLIAGFGLALADMLAHQGIANVIPLLESGLLTLTADSPENRSRSFVIPITISR